MRRLRLQLSLQVDDRSTRLQLRLTYKATATATTVAALFGARFTYTAHLRLSNFEFEFTIHIREFSKPAPKYVLLTSAAALTISLKSIHIRRTSAYFEFALDCDFATHLRMHFQATATSAARFGLRFGEQGDSDGDICGSLWIALSQIKANKATATATSAARFGLRFGD